MGCGYSEVRNFKAECEGTVQWDCHTAFGVIHMEGLLSGRLQLHEPISSITIPLHRHTLPLHRRTLPLHRHTLPLHRHTLPLHRHTLPLHRHTLPLHHRYFLARTLSSQVILASLIRALVSQQMRRWVRQVNAIPRKCAQPVDLCVFHLLYPAVLRQRPIAAAAHLPLVKQHSKPTIIRAYTPPPMRRVSRHSTVTPQPLGKGAPHLQLSGASEWRQKRCMPPLVPGKHCARIPLSEHCRMTRRLLRNADGC